MSDHSAFNWATDDSIAVQSQPGIAVYLNPSGDVVIRQEGYYGPEEDQFVVISPGNVHKVAAKMIEVANETPETDDQAEANAALARDLNEEDTIKLSRQMRRGA